MKKEVIRGTTIFILINTSKWSEGFDLRLGDVLNSPAAELFLNTFIFPEKMHSERDLSFKLRKRTSKRYPPFSLKEE